MDDFIGIIMALLLELENTTRCDSKFVISIFPTVYSDISVKLS